MILIGTEHFHHHPKFSCCPLIGISSPSHTHFLLNFQQLLTCYTCLQFFFHFKSIVEMELLCIWPLGICVSLSIILQRFRQILMSLIFFSYLLQNGSPWFGYIISSFDLSHAKEHFGCFQTLVSTWEDKLIQPIWKNSLGISSKLQINFKTSF